MDDLATSSTSVIDWSVWLQRWEDQQAAHVPDRDERFDAMLDVLAALLPPDFVAVDLACGPGSLAARLLDRFPRAQCIGVDLDPVLLALGRGALGDAGGRMSFVEADLAEPGWTAFLPEGPFDAVLSTTALHWLAVEPVVRLYRDLARIINPGGVMLNGDHLAYPRHLETFQMLSEWSAARRGGEHVALPGREDWDAWWTALRQVPELETLFQERDRRFAGRLEREDLASGLDVHEASLREAGFREVGVVWQHLDNRVLLGVRSS